MRNLSARFAILITLVIVLTGGVLIGGFLAVERGYLLLEGRKAHQTNTRGAERLYQIIKEGLPTSGGTLFDLYCGSGSIGLFCADRVERVIGIELNPQSVADARSNAEAFGVSQAEFHAMDASTFAKSAEFLERWKSPGARAVLDPPRPGLQPEVRKLLLGHPIQQWIYVSFNPEALARDLVLLSPAYLIDRVQVVDLFPHTPHVETVVVLHKRPANGVP